jgi:hypothetical protein
MIFERLHNIEGKIDMIQDLKIEGLGLTLDQQEKLLAIHSRLINQRYDELNRIKKEYIC